jgi:hypothetical protein
MNVDLGPTLLELAGVPDAWPSGTNRRDGRSLTPLMRDPATPPSDWRSRMLIEFVGFYNGPTNDPYEWLSPKQFALTNSTDTGLINGASNRWVALRVANASTETLIADFRPPGTIGRSATNFTEAFDLSVDPESITNLAVKGRLSPQTIEQMRTELWAVADCAGTSCP